MISIVAVAAVIVVETGGSPTPGWRSARARRSRGGCPPSRRTSWAGRQRRRLVDVVRRGHLADLAPIDDVRGTAAYRSDAVRTLVRRALAEVVA